MKDLGWTAFFALLVCVIAVYYLGKGKDGPAVLITDEYAGSEASMVPDRTAAPAAGFSDVDEENLDFYAKPPARKPVREPSKVNRSSGGSAAPSTYYSNKRAEQRDREAKPAKATTSYASAATLAKQEAARKANERAVAAEKKLAEEKKRKSESFVSAEKKLKHALQEEDLRTANKAAREMEKELGVDVEFAPAKPGEKLPDNPLTRKKH